MVKIHSHRYCYTQLAASYIYGADMGMNDIFKWCEVKNFNHSFKDGYVNPEKSPRLSNHKFLNQMRLKAARNDELNLPLSKCSLKASKNETFPQNVRPWLKLTDGVLKM